MKWSRKIRVGTKIILLETTLQQVHEKILWTEEGADSGYGCGYGCGFSNYEKWLAVSSKYTCATEVKKQKLLLFSPQFFLMFWLQAKHRSCEISRRENIVDMKIEASKFQFSKRMGGWTLHHVRSRIKEEYLFSRTYSICTSEKNLSVKLFILCQVESAMHIDRINKVCSHNWKNSGASPLPSVSSREIIQIATWLLYYKWRIIIVWSGDCCFCGKSEIKNDI